LSRPEIKSAIFMLVAISIAILSAIAFMNEISIHIWFNHLDLSHTLMAMAAYFFFKGANSFKEKISLKYPDKVLRLKNPYFFKVGIIIITAVPTTPAKIMIISTL
jgi:hypothetical protein